jgi:hypothetical protein
MSQTPRSVAAAIEKIVSNDVTGQEPTVVFNDAELQLPLLLVGAEAASWKLARAKNEINPCFERWIIVFDLLRSP